MTEPSPLVIVAAAPRTGSNHLCNILSGFENHAAHTEVFDRGYAYTTGQEILEKVEEITGCIIPRDRTGALIDPGCSVTTQLLYDEPIATINALSLCREEHQTSFSLKLFGYHLPRHITHQLLTGDHTVIVLKRRCIDSYISKLKAQQIRKWCYADTTYIKPTADIRDFAYWYDRNNGWYQHIDECRGDPVYLIRFEDMGGNDTWIDAMRSAIPHDLGDWSADRCRLAPLTKQDRNSEPGDKLANWDEFQAELEKHGMLDAAMGYF